MGHSGYDKAGNMIGIPNPTISSTATYDAWNRLISVTDASTSITNDYDARGFRITETTGGVVRHYYYTPGWQCVEERTGTLTTPERQFVWGMRYIDDLVIRDRSTANNGSINERRYAMQDGNWNTVAICDITGTVGERYAYSAYGTPVFMTGAGAVQASSPIGFETLYAGYRWDNASPQMYYVRNRFLLPQVGTWNKRDPLGYVDGMALYRLTVSTSRTDPSGKCPPESVMDRRMEGIRGLSGSGTPSPLDGRYANCPAKKQAQIRAGKLQYSCKCGWIDWTHAGGPEKNREKQGTALRDLVDLIQKMRELAKQPRGDSGRLCYGTSQQVPGGLVNSGVQVCFYVSTGLSQKEIECAAWEMFQVVQYKFESHQCVFGVGSGFSPEDLPSDLLLFRRALNGLSDADVNAQCAPVFASVQQNLALCTTFDWNAKNTDWNPIPCSAAASLCNGDSSSGLLEMPKTLAPPRCDPSGEGNTWRRSGREYSGLYPEAMIR